MSVDPAVRRLVDAVLLPGFLGTAPPDWLRREVDVGLAGVVYFGHNVTSPGQVASLSAALHELRPDVLVASDEEGGDVTRLEARDGSSYPGNAALGRIDDPAATEAVGRAIGRDLRVAGVDVDLAPTVDVNADPDNPVIGVRSFGDDSALVARHAAAFVTGLQGAGVAACAKHFPGHGDTAVDSHLDLPVVGVDVDVLRRRDLPPFAASVAAGVRCVLTAHIRFPALDPRPATLSPVVLGMLRDELGFDGVVVTDALDMHAIVHGVGTGPGAVLALAAGADLLCIGNPANREPADDVGDLAEVRDAVLAAVADGTLQADRLEEAAGRVRSLAEWAAAGRATALPDAAPGLGVELARRALVTTGDVRLRGAPHVLDLRSHVSVAAGRHAPRVRDELARREPATTASPHPAAGDDRRELPARVLAEAGERPLVMVVDEPHRDPVQADLLADLTARRPDAVVVCTGWPDPRTSLGERAVVTFGAGRANAVAAVEAMLG